MFGIFKILIFNFKLRNDTLEGLFDHKKIIIRFSSDSFQDLIRCCNDCGRQYP